MRTLTANGFAKALRSAFLAAGALASLPLRAQMPGGGPPPLPPELQPGSADIVEDPALVPVPDPWQWVWYGAGGLLALGALALGLCALVYLLRHRRARVAEAAVPTPLEEARTGLARAQEALDTLPDATFAQAVSDVLRRYLERALHWPAPEQTTEEFLRNARRSAFLDTDAASALGQFLQTCDLAKFATARLPRPERERLLREAGTFVDTFHAHVSGATSPAATSS